MSEKRPQTLNNHAKFVPGYHFITFGMAMLVLIWSVIRLFQLGFAVDRIAVVVLILALIGTAYYTRVFALKVQDRLIRLEERFRMTELLPEDLRHRSNELTVNQMVALRFASDEELGELVREVLDKNIRQRAAIKKKIRSWRADYDRC